MTKKVIAIDADDTIFDENTAVRLYMNETYGFTHTEADYLVEGPFENYWERVWGLDPEVTNEMYEQFVISPHKENLQPVPGALQTLKRLKQRYELVVVTSRDDRTVSLTHQALAQHYPEIFSDVHFVPLWGKSNNATKAMICNEIGASYLVDDGFRHCELAAQAGVTAILFGSYGWNKYQVLPNGITRCATWDDVAKVLL